MSASRKNIGKCSEVAWKFEWKIDNFFSLTEENSSYYSPTFKVSNSTWFILICPNGDTSRGSGGYVSLFLCNDVTPDTVGVNYGFGIRTVNHVTVNELKGTFISDFNQGHGWPEFIGKSELLARRSVMVPSGTLTIVCSVEVRNSVPIIYEGHANLAEHFQELFISRENSDATLNVKEETYRVHKAVLCARSPVLAATFRNEMKEKETGIVDIPDCDPQAFRVFLLFLYSGSVNFTECNIYELYKISDKYDVSELKLKCVDFMTEDISLDNFSEICILSNQFGEEELLTEVHRFFKHNFKKVVSSKSWESLLRKDFRLANTLLKGMAETLE